MSGIILDSGTKSCLFEHLNIKIRSLCNSLCFDQLIMFFKICHLLSKFFLDPFDRTLNLFLWYNIM